MTRPYRIRILSPLRLAGNPHDVGHVVEASRPAHNPLRRADRPTRKDRPVGRSVGELDALAFSYEIKGVLADHVAASERHHAHLS